MKINWLYIILIILTVIGSACGVQPAHSSAEPTAVISQPATATNNEATLLLWEGPALFVEDQTECHRLLVTKDHQALIGQCDSEQTKVEFVTNRKGGLADMIARFAPFQADTPQGRITFNGEGKIAGPAWERAIISWAQLTYAELASGRVGAANRTVLAWSLGEQSGQPGWCQILLVLVHGYATAGLTPCEGGQIQVLGGDWVDTAEWDQFDIWLYKNAPFYQENNYLDGRGATEMSAEEVAALAEWAEGVYAKLTQTVDVTATATPAALVNAPARCLTPATDQQLLLDEANGYCLLYPADYSLAQPIPDSAELVKGDIMNHIDPRVSIQVTNAAGRSLADVVRQMEADYVPPGFTVERGTITVDGVEAVMLDNLPGQDLNRRVFFIQNGRLYSFFFAPIGDEGSDTRRQAEALYQQVLVSFRFLS